MGTNRPKNDAIRNAFQGCQDNVAVHPKLIRKLKYYYMENDADKFFESFMYYLKYPISGYTERSVFVDRILEFAAKFACSFLEKDEDEKKDKDKDKDVSETSNLETTEGEEVDGELPLFLYRLFSWLLEHHEVEGSEARLRVCQLLNKLLKYMGEEACIDDDLYYKIYDGMLERLKDKVAEIRSQAVTALQRLQDPKDEECPIIKAYLFHLAHDPNHVVRRTIVRCIGATRLTLPHILERTRDTDEHVRRAAYKFLAEKVHIKSLTIGQREGLLQRGLGERSEAVRRVVEKELLPAWLRLSGDNIVQLLHHLDVGNSDQDATEGPGRRPNLGLPTTTNALNVLFQESSNKELMECFQYLDGNRLIPYEKLTAETAMYWRVLAQYLRQQKSSSGDEWLEHLLPELTPFCQYVRRYVLEKEKEEDEINWEFVSRELIAITMVFDLGDETGRQNLVSLVKALLTSPKTPASFIPALVAVFTKVEKDPTSRINQVAECISELKEPLNQTRNDTTQEVFFDARSDPESPKKANNVAAQNEREILAKQMEEAKIRVAMNEAKEELNQAVADQDFLKAQEIKARFDDLEEEHHRAEEELRTLKGTSVSPDDSEPEPTTIPESDDEDSMPQLLAVDSPTVTLKCLKLLTATLQDPKIVSLNATLHTLLETFVTVSVQSELAAVRREAIVTLCCLCLRSPESARQHMLLLLQAAHIDVHEVRLVAISAVVDLLMRHGLASFISSVSDTINESGSGSDLTASRTDACPDTTDIHTNIESVLESDMATRGATLTQKELNTQGGNSVVAILSKILDESDLELRTETAEGLCKLLMIGAISSPKLLSRLLLIWYNPMTEPSCKLRHILGTFFPLYCSMSRHNQEAMEAAFIPTMRVLFDAPITSPLNEIDVEDVGMFFVHLTREDMLQSYDANKREVAILASSSTSVHDSIAKLVSNEILSSPEPYQSKVLIKVLTNLQLTHNNYVHLRELKVLSEQLLETVTERTTVKQLEKFDKLLTDWLTKDPDHRSDSPSINKRRSSIQPVDNEDGNVTESSSGKKRTLFSQSQANLLVPDTPDIQVDPSSEDETTIHEKSKIPSPVVPNTLPSRPSSEKKLNASGAGDISNTRILSESLIKENEKRENEEEGEENEGELTIMPEDGNVCSRDGEEIEVAKAVDNIAVTNKGEGNGTFEKKDDKSKANKLASRSSFFEVMAASDSEVSDADSFNVSKSSNILKKGKKGKKAAEESASDEDDIFSDASVSSFGGGNVSKLSRLSILGSSDDSGSDNEVPIPSLPVSQAKGRGGIKGRATRGGKGKGKGRGTQGKSGGMGFISEEDTEDEVIEATPPGSKSKRAPTSISSAQPSKGKAEAASPNSTPKSRLKGRSSSSSLPHVYVTKNSPTPMQTPPTVKKNIKGSAKVSDEESIDVTPTSSKISISSVTEKTAAATLSSPGITRIGRSNSPRINYKTGQKLTPEPTVGPKPRKRSSEKSKSSNSGSATSSPVSKKTTPKKTEPVRKTRSQSKM